jgi:formylglycine-generating enzyme required for sulfatase activity
MKIAHIIFAAAATFLLTLPLQAGGFTNQLGMEFANIKAGTFLMGNDPSQYEAPESDEEPRHRVTISNDFFIGATEVTQAQWEKVMGDNPSEKVGPDYPVENITPEEAQDFIDRLNGLGDGYAYRLPTEAEWEYAVRAGTETPWHFGDTPDSLEDYDWVGSNSNSTHPVGKKLPNPWGLYDVHGNVKELVSDFYSIDYYKNSPERDPLGPGPDHERDQVVRGGAWYNSPERTRSSYRYFLDDGERNEDIGFRLACSSVPEAAWLAPPDTKTTSQGSEQPQPPLPKKLFTK